MHRSAAGTRYAYASPRRPRLMWAVPGVPMRFQFERNRSGKPRSRLWLTASASSGMTAPCANHQTGGRSRQSRVAAGAAVAGTDVGARATRVWPRVRSRT